MAVRAKHFEYSVSLDRAGRPSAESEAPIELREPWSAEHLLLAALAHCSISSLQYFAGLRGADAVASAFASGTVTRRRDDRYGFVEIECRIEAEIEPEPPPRELVALLDSAEWGCFVGASIQPAPTYAWRVNGRDVT